MLDSINKTANSSIAAKNDFHRPEVKLLVVVIKVYFTGVITGLQCNLPKYIYKDSFPASLFPLHQVTKLLS